MQEVVKFNVLAERYGRLNLGPKLTQKLIELGWRKNDYLVITVDEEKETLTVKKLKL